jgi:DNA-binding transcriptional LysR family regulator
MVDITHLADFLELARAGNFSVAAQRRHVSQPALSRRIQQLEQWAGGLLLDRSSSPVRLTRMGEEFSIVAADAVAQLEEFRRRQAPKNSAPSVRLISLYSLTSTFLPAWFAEGNRRRRPPEFEIAFGSYCGCFEALRDGTSDVALLYFTDVVQEPRFAGLHRLRIATESFIPVMSKEYARSVDEARRGGPDDRSLSIIELKRDIYLGNALGAAVDRCMRQFPNSVALVASRMDVIRGLVEAGYGIGWLPAASIGDQLADGRLKRLPGGDLEVAFEIVLIARSEHYLSLLSTGRDRAKPGDRHPGTNKLRLAPARP